MYNPKTGDIVLIQVKTKKGGRGVVIKNKTLDYGRKIETWEQHYE